VELFDYDPLTGIRTLWEHDEETGKGIFRREQDVSAVVDYTTGIRNQGLADAELKKDDYMCLYAMIPAGVEMELLAKGISLYDKNATKRLLDEINVNYPYLKVTDKRHSGNR
jgi:hypothetical protein